MILVVLSLKACDYLADTYYDDCWEYYHSSISAKKAWIQVTRMRSPLLMFARLSSYQGRLTFTISPGSSDEDGGE